jgi:hypothetical protein
MRFVLANKLVPKIFSGCLNPGTVVTIPSIVRISLTLQLISIIFFFNVPSIRRPLNSHHCNSQTMYEVQDCIFFQITTHSTLKFEKFEFGLMLRSYFMPCLIGQFLDYYLPFRFFLLRSSKIDFLPALLS